MDIELWLVDLDDLADRPGALSVVTARDRAAGDRLPAGQLRQRFVARRAATRLVLGRSLGLVPDQLQIRRRCARCGDQGHGRPTLSGLLGDFNVASSGAAAVVAVSEHRVGVDLETVPDLGLPGGVLPRSVLAPGELGFLDSLSSDRRPRAFLQLWAIKEAVLKADGSGLLLDPASVDATTVASEGVDEITLTGRSWTVRTIPPPPNFKVDVVLALAGPEDLRISWRSLTW